MQLASWPTLLPTLNSPIEEAPELDIKDWQDTYKPSVNGHKITLEEYETSRTLAIAPGAQRFLLGAERSLRCFDGNGSQHWDQATPGINWGLNVSRDGRLGIAAYGDGTIRWHRMSDGRELLAFFPHSDRKRWVLCTPGGYYDCSYDGESLIRWHVNRGQDKAAEQYPAARFRATYYRPDVIQRVLTTLDEAEALHRANAAKRVKPKLVPRR